MKGRLKRREADVENCGIDVATKSSSVCILDGRGTVLLEQAVSSDEEGLASVLNDSAGKLGVISQHVVPMK